MSRLNLGRFVEDERLPSRDAKSALAELEIDSSHFDAIGDVIQTSWPSVQAVVCFVPPDEFQKPTIKIHLDPYSTDAMRQNWCVEDRIAKIIDGVKCIYIFLPPLGDEPLSSDNLVIYKRSQANEGVAS